MSTTNKALPKPPSTPRVRVLHDIAVTLNVSPYFLAGDNDLIQEAIKQGRIKDLYGDDAFFAVGVGHLKMRHYLDYERMYGETLDTVVNRILWVFWALNKQISPSIDSLETPVIETQDGKTKTPFGDLVGSLALNIADLLGFALSRIGQIVGVEADFQYKYANVDPADIIDLLDPHSLMKVDEEDGTPLLFEILELTGLYNPRLQEATVPKAETEVDDELKNLKTPRTSQRKDGSSTKS